MMRLCSIIAALLVLGASARAQPLLSNGDFPPAVGKAPSTSDPSGTPSMDNPLSIIGAATSALQGLKSGEAAATSSDGSTGKSPVQGLSTGINVLLVVLIMGS